MSAAALAAFRPAHVAGRDLASGIFALPLDLASGFSRSEPANDTGKNVVAYDEVTSESCYWTSKDPTRFAGGVNLYAYADNDPVNYVDRTGRHPEDGSDGGSPGGPLQDEDGLGGGGTSGGSGAGGDWDDAGMCGDDENCKKKCDSQYERDGDVCRQLKNPLDRKICWEKAADDYGACLKKC